MADKQKKENFFKRAASKIAGGAKSTKSEVKKIAWPTKKQLLNNTGIVIVCIVIVGIVIFLLDTFFGFGFSFLTGRKANTDVELPTEISTEVIFDDAAELATVEAVTEPAE